MQVLERNDWGAYQLNFQFVIHHEAATCIISLDRMFQKMDHCADPEKQSVCIYLQFRMQLLRGTISKLSGAVWTAPTLEIIMPLQLPTP